MMFKNNLNFAIMASGNGSNAEALIKSFRSGKISANLSLIVSNKEGANVLNIARKNNIPGVCIPHDGLKRKSHEKKILNVLADYNINHVLLAGYMRILTPYFLDGVGGKVINIHPSLLPEFPGANAIEDQWKSGEKIVGATVHFVDYGVDTGEKILMGSLELGGEETVSEVAKKVLTEVEHVIYSRAVSLFVNRCIKNEVKNV